MFYLTSTILVLVLQTTLTTITALEHFAVVPRDKYALLPRMDPWPIPGGVGIDNDKYYMETHPCARSFKGRRSSRYTLHTSQGRPTILGHTLGECSKIKSSAAWWSAKSECVPLPEKRNTEKTHPDLHSTRGDCFIFKPDENWNENALRAWQHPCENHRFSPTLSLWYTRWNHMTYEKCRETPNAGAWRLTGAGCFVFFGPPEVWRKPPATFSDKQGMCFVLDKIPVDKSYVEVHPCDKFFLFGRSTLFSPIDPPGSTPFTFDQCLSLPEAVAWASQLDPPNSECVPIQRSDKGGQLPLLVDSVRKQVRLKSGICFKFNADKAPIPLTGVTDSISLRVPYKHVCEYKFNGIDTRWYTGFPVPMTLEACGKKENAAAWRRGVVQGFGKMSCFVFYWDSSTQNVASLDGTEKGECFIRDKVVPLGSLSPPRRIVTMHHPQLEHGHPLLVA